MKYEELKEEIKSISEIAGSVPEAFRERCFEVLLQNLLQGSTSAHTSAKTKTEADENEDAAGKLPKPAVSASESTIPTPAQIKVFLQKTGLTAEELARVTMFEDGAVLFVHEPKTNKIARGQIEWALLLALKNGIENNVLAADPEKVRSICQEKGFYDKANFLKNFRGTTTAAYFTGPMDAQGESQKLTAEGMKELAKIIKDLGSA